MGKKKGKKGKKGKKTGKKKEPQMTVKEAILSYRISILEKKLEDINYIKHGWEEKNRRHLERNCRLKAEQELLVDNLLKQAKDVGKTFEDEETKTRDDVTTAMRGIWQRRREREWEVEDLKSRIAKKDAELETALRELKIWQDYRDHGRLEHQKMIAILEEDVFDMQSNFEELVAQYDRNMTRYKNQVSLHTNRLLAQQKDQATDHAIKQLDLNSRREVLDNNWLHREMAIYQEQVAQLTTTTEELERDNLSVMRKLFECNVEDLNISRQLFLTQFSDTNNLETDGILEIDLQEYSPFTLKPHVGDLAIDRTPKEFGLPDSDGEVFENLFYEEEDFNDLLALGPLELKLLSVTGRQMAIHVPTLPSNEELAVEQHSPKSWPVTRPMLQKVVSPEPKMA